MEQAACTQVIAVDVGNTTTGFGLFSVSGGGAPELMGSCELTTPARLTVDEARIQLAQALSLLPAISSAGAILSCVVPALTGSWRRALATSSESRPLTVGPGLKTGLAMRYDDPAEVGSDRIADAVAARASYGAPVIVVDLGTTTNIEIIDASGAFAGGIIAPGAALGARSLADAAARLPIIELMRPKRAIGRSTREAMQAGIVLGEAARIDGLLDAVLCELEAEAPIVITGDNAASIAKLLQHRTTVDGSLTLRGLALLWQANQRR